MLPVLINKTMKDFAIFHRYFFSTKHFMKNSSFLIIAILISFSIMACNKKTGEKVQNEATSTETPTEVKDDNTPKTVQEDPTPALDYEFLSYKKTPCFGKCPVYEVKFFRDGRASYNGKMNTEREGLWIGKIDKEMVDELRDKIQAVHFFDFENKYPTGDVQIADLPSTIINVRIGDMVKQVTDKHDAPKALKSFEKYVEKKIEQVKWIKPAEKKN